MIVGQIILYFFSSFFDSKRVDIFRAYQGIYEILIMGEIFLLCMRVTEFFFIYHYAKF